MLSDSTLATLDELHAKQQRYIPNQTVRQTLSSKDLLCIVGASCMGKTTIMDILVQASDLFGEFTTFTSRPPRPDERSERYIYYNHTDEGLAELFESIRRGEVVQYNVNPYSKYIYGSFPSGYRYEHNIGDVFSSSVDHYCKIGFRSVTSITIISEPTEWLERFNARFPQGDFQRVARLDEAIQSFEWSLSQMSSSHNFIINRNNQPNDAAAEIMRDKINAKVFAATQSHARHLARCCLAKAREVRL